MDLTHYGTPVSRGPDQKALSSIFTYRLLFGFIQPRKLETMRAYHACKLMVARIEDLRLTSHL